MPQIASNPLVYFVKRRELVRGAGARSIVGPTQRVLAGTEPAFQASPSAQPFKGDSRLRFLGLVAAIALNMLELVGSPAADLTIFFFFPPFPFLFHLPSTALHPYLRVYCKKFFYAVLFISLCVASGFTIDQREPLYFSSWLPISSQAGP